MPISDNERIWLNAIYKKFLNDGKIEEKSILAQLWDTVPEDFDPKNIDHLLANYGKDITILGIWNIDPDSKIFDVFDKIVKAIRQVLIKNPNINEVRTEQIQEIHPEINNIDIYHVFRLLFNHGGFGNSLGKSDDYNCTIGVNDDTTYNEYRKYKGLEKLVLDFYNKYKNENTEPFQPAEIENDRIDIDLTEKAHMGMAEVLLRDRKQIDKVLGIKGLAKEISDIINRISMERGMMIGVFGKWGRGKTVLLEEIWEHLKEIKENNKSQYAKVEYHAWKYQETPASWAYLYEAFAEKYYNKPKLKFYNWPYIYFPYWVRIIRLNIKRFGLIPILKFAISVVFSAGAIMGTILLDEKLNINHLLSFIGIPIISTVFLAVANELNKEYSTDAYKLIKKYGLKQSYKDSMGLQAEIQKEIVNLLKAWIKLDKKSNNKQKKIVLFVEDIDRCEENKIIQNIDSLRIMLEDDEVSERLIIITAIDEAIVKRAVFSKYRHLMEKKGENEDSEIDQIISEYLDKLFILGIRLGDLSLIQRLEYFEALTKKDQPEKLKANHPNNADKNSENVQVREFVMPDNSNTDFIQEEGATSSHLSEDPDKFIRSGDFGKLTETEIQILNNCLASWNHSTPRKIRIFYYRYLLGKNLLLKRYQELRKNNIWQHPKYVNVFANLIVKYSETYTPELITVHKLDALNHQKSTISVKLLANETIDKTDYILGLEILEMIIAY